MMDYSQVNPLAETAKVFIPLALGTLGIRWAAKRLRMRWLDTLWCVFVGMILVFTVGAWIWTVATAGAM